MRRPKMTNYRIGRAQTDPRVVVKSAILFAVFVAVAFGLFAWHATRPPERRPSDDRAMCADGVRVSAPAAVEALGLTELQEKPKLSAMFPDGKRRSLLVSCFGIAPVRGTEDRAVMRGEIHLDALPPMCRGRGFHAQIRWELRRVGKFTKPVPELAGFALEAPADGCPDGPMPAE